MDAGRLRDRVILQRPVDTRDANFNSKVTTWHDVISGGVWAEVKDVADRNTESNANQQHANVRRREVTIRWMAGVSTAWRVQVNGETHIVAGQAVPLYFQVVSMADVGGYRDGIQLMCEEYRS